MNKPLGPKKELNATEVLHELAASIDRLNLRTTLTLVATFLNAVAVVVVIFMALSLQGVARTNESNGAATAANTARLEQNQADTNRILSAVESVTSAEARATSRAASEALVANVTAEISCDGRRQQARLAAAPPGKCRATTPLEIYPGIDGQPPRG